jgi:RNA polymerase sigma-70 factor (ECF subfamily)
MNTWQRQVRRLKEVLRNRGQSREDAEDLVQEAFLRLHTFLADGHEVRQPEGFLVRTALNLAVDARRRNVRERRDQFVPETVEDLQLVDLSPSPEEIFAAEKRLLQMRAVLDAKVSPKTREVFFLHRLEGFTHEEIADRMSMSLRSVEKHIARAITVVWMERQRE